MNADRPYPALAEVLKALLGTDALRCHESLARYTALRLGGSTDLLVTAGNAETLRQAVTAAWQQEVPCRVLGAGSNVLVSDAGVRGLVVLNRAKALAFGEITLRAESGANLSTAARQAIARGLTGLEWAVGIPGSVGGAVVGNAGAWGGNVASILVGAKMLEPPGRVALWPVEQFQYGYRTSVLKQQAASSKRTVILEAEFALKPGDVEALKARVADITARRKASQPPGASCGSVFKNPPGDHAGRLIEAAGLKGRKTGGAEISPVHANFIINHGQATATDVKALIDLARETVQARFGVSLELEIELLGEW